MEWLTVLKETHVLTSEQMFEHTYTVWRETLVVGKFGELPVNHLWQNEI